MAYKKCWQLEQFKKNQKIDNKLGLRDNGNSKFQNIDFSLEGDSWVNKIKTLENKSTR